MNICDASNQEHWTEMWQLEETKSFFDQYSHAVYKWMVAPVVKVKSGSLFSLCVRQLCPHPYCCFPSLCAKVKFLRLWHLGNVFLSMHAKWQQQWRYKTTCHIVWKECCRQHSVSSHSLSPSHLGSGPSSSDKYSVPLIYQGFFDVQSQPGIEILLAKSNFFYGLIC